MWNEGGGGKLQGNCFHAKVYNVSYTQYSSNEITELNENRKLGILLWKICGKVVLELNKYFSRIIFLLICLFYSVTLLLILFLSSLCGIDGSVLSFVFWLSCFKHPENKFQIDFWWRNLKIEQATASFGVPATAMPVCDTCLHIPSSYRFYSLFVIIYI